MNEQDDFHCPDHCCACFADEMACIQAENVRLREAANGARILLRFFTRYDEEANRVTYEIDKRDNIYKELCAVLDKDDAGGGTTDSVIRKYVSRLVVH